jgi:hypothetical protein
MGTAIFLTFSRGIKSKISTEELGTVFAGHGQASLEALQAVGFALETGSCSSWLRAIRTSSGLLFSPLLTHHYHSTCLDFQFVYSKFPTILIKGTLNSFVKIKSLLNITNAS